jgi:aldehyde dehydrogenase (NAD+)
VVGQVMLENKLVNAVTFTGSVDTGKHVLSTTTARLAKAQIEMGGKNPMVVLDDSDLEVAVNCAVQSAFYSTGQRCTAASRIIVQKGIYNRFIDAVVQRMSALCVDDALKVGSDIGPVVDQAQLTQDIDYIAVGREEGARLVIGGQAVTRSTKGFYLTPALFADASNQMRIAREEIFGPVACVIPVSDYEEALALANDTEFGLSSGICTTSLKYATHFKRHSESGMVMVNVPTAGVDYHVPFGGRKGSSYGSREQGSYAAEFFTTVKTSYTQA